MKVRKKDNKKLHSFRIKGFFKKVKEKFLDIYTPNVVWLAMPFALMDVFIFIFGSNINYSSYLFISPMLFSITWILLFIGISLSFKGIIGKIFYSFFNILFMIMFLVNNIYYSLMKTFFDFSLVDAASEGSHYMLDAVISCNKLVYVAFAFIIIFYVIGLKKMPKVEKNDYKKLGYVCLIFLVLHLICPLTFGKANTHLTWSSWRNPRNIYNSFNDNNKSMRVSGFYEYTVRNFYVTFIKSNAQISEEEIEFLDDAYVEELSTKNKYTSKFKGKNLIIIQLEGIDSWLLNKNDTPTLYKMMNEGVNFTNHFSFYNGGGSTFNSEFAVNTGYVTPLSYTQNAYSFSKNEFPDTLAKKFKDEGYSVNAFHMNTGEFYSRTINYKTWGYDNYYGLIDRIKYDDDSYELDRELILKEEFSDLMFPEDTNFVDYIITYTSHTPFNNTKEACKVLYDLDNEGKDVEFTQMSEEECARRQVRETDYMIELLLEKMKEKNVLDNTAIVVFTDHYLYTLTDQSIIAKYKDVETNMINKTPWFIWSKGLKKASVKQVTSQLNILPTILNLYGISYNKNRYIGGDALGNKYSGIVFFNDYSWYDGNVYVENGEIVKGKKISADALEEKNQYVNYMAKKNDLTLKYNYFKK